MEYIKKDKYFVVRFPDNTFLHLYRSNTCSIPSRVDSPLDAEKIRPLDNNFDTARKPDYYFCPRRGKSWTEGGELVLVESKTTATIKLK